jgi:hypothetical protein
MNYAIEMTSGSMTYMPSFGSGVQKLLEEDYTQSKVIRIMCLLLFYQRKKRKLG